MSLVEACLVNRLNRKNPIVARAYPEVIGILYSAWLVVDQHGVCADLQAWVM